MITREEALEIINEMLKNKNLVRHCLAVEAIMRGLCNYLKKREGGDEVEFNEDEWGIVGLLHDGDYEVTNKDLETHTDLIVAKLKELGESERVINGILAHHALKKPNRENYLEKAIYAADELSGLITACALVKPDKKLENVSVDTVIKKFKQSGFAAGAHRHQILLCETELQIPLRDFIDISLESMKKISDELGL